MQKVELNNDIESFKTTKVNHHKKHRRSDDDKVWFKRRRVKKRAERVLWIVLLAAFLTSLFLIWPEVIKRPKATTGKIK